MRRRDFLSAATALALTACVVDRPATGSKGPQFWLARRNSSRVFILGFGEARDRSWFTPEIQEAFAQSSALWLETAPHDPNHPPSAEESAEFEKLSHEIGRTFFDALEPAVCERTRAYIASVGISEESIESLRPWRAFYILNDAFLSKKKSADELVYVDGVLRELATAAQKKIGYEWNTVDAAVRFMASMPDKAQSQYITFLLDYIDDEENGLNNDRYDWIGGDHRHAVHAIQRMRNKTPDLYQIMQPQRNEWWARKITGILASDGETSFVALGQMHVTGTDAVPRQLERLGVTLQPLTSRS